MEQFSFSFLKSGVVWSNIVTVLYFFFGAVAKAYPNTAVVGGIVLALNFILNTYFHKSAVLAAARSSAALGKSVSGQ